MYSMLKHTENQALLKKKFKSLSTKQSQEEKNPTRLQQKRMKGGNDLFLLGCKLCILVILALNIYGQKTMSRLKHKGKGSASREARGKCCGQSAKYRVGLTPKFMGSQKVILRLNKKNITFFGLAQVNLSSSQGRAYMCENTAFRLLFWYRQFTVEVGQSVILRDEYRGFVGDR